MGKVHIRGITLTAWRQFRDRQSVRLPHTGLVGIRGINKDTGGSSAAGKSSIPLAIAYAFGFCPFPASEQQNWDTKTPMQVELFLDVDDDKVGLLRRGKEFSLTVGDTQTKGAAKIVEEAITRMTGLPATLLEALTYRQQQQRSRFLFATDAEKKEFLSILLGAQELEDQIAEATKKSNTLQAEADQIRRGIEFGRSVLPPEPAMPQLESLVPYEEQRAKAMMTPLVAAPPPFVAPATKAAEIAAQRQEVQRRVEALRPHVMQEKQAIADKITEHMARATSASNAARQLFAIRQSITSIEGEQVKLAASQCPTCSREWVEAEQRRKDNDAKLADLYIQRNVATSAAEEAVAFQNLADAARQQLADYRNDVFDKLNEIYTQLQQAEFRESMLGKVAEQEYAALVTKHRNEVSARDNAIAMAEWKLEQTKKANDQLVLKYRQDVQNYQSAKKSLDDKEAQLQQLQKDANEEADYAAALKSYLGSLFDEVLEQVSAETNELLRSIPNTATTTVQFTSETVTLKGTPKQEIKPIICRRGKPVSLKSGISGGQLEAVELAVDLSIVKVIGQRTGVRPGFMIFDEAFSAHCLPVKMACLEVLQRAAQDCMILVVDHSSELKEYFSHFIDVECEREVSRFVESGDE